MSKEKTNKDKGKYKRTKEKTNKGQRKRQKKGQRKRQNEKGKDNMTKTARQVLQMGGKARKRPTALIVEVDIAVTAGIIFKSRASMT